MKIESEDVFLHKGHIFDPGRQESGPERIHEPCILFHGNDLTNGSGQGDGQDPGAGADLEDPILLPNPGLGDDSMNDSPVAQEVLTQPLAGTCSA
jgi:hypothetical protein